MKAKSISGKSTEEIKSAIEKSMSDEFKPTLAIVFISIKQDRKAVCELIQSKGIDIVGSTSCGEFINDYQSMGETAILLMDIKKKYYSILYEEISDKKMEEIAAILSQKAKQKFNNPAFIICSTGVSEKKQIFNGASLIIHMEKVLGPGTNIYGGMAGDDATFKGSYVFTNEFSTDSGVVALVLDQEKISLHGTAISGWKPLGITRTVTKCEGGWICAIDDQPALEMYLKYLGKELLPGDDKFKLFEEVGIHHPFLMEELNNPVIRTPFMVNKEKEALRLDFDVPEGTKFRFSMPPDFDIVENILEKATEIKNNSNEEADALLIFSCFGRLSALGPLVKLENDGLGEIWKAPMAGFFTYGEYGTSSGGKQEFHSTTCSWVALKEKL